MYDADQLDERTPGRHFRISLSHCLFPSGLSGVFVILTPNKKNLFGVIFEKGIDKKKTLKA